MLISASAYSMFTIFGKTVLKELDAVDVLLWRFFIAVPAAWLFIVIRHRPGSQSILGGVETSFCGRPGIWFSVVVGFCRA